MFENTVNVIEGFTFLISDSHGDARAEIDSRKTEGLFYHQGGTRKVVCRHPSWDTQGADGNSAPQAKGTRESKSCKPLRHLRLNRR
jgi:hypothetical protein